jgi:class 3 adenylate cyclase
MVDISKFPFESTAKPPQQALAVIFDLEGFSSFFAQPDVQTYMPRYLNRIFECLNIVFQGGTAYWIQNEKYPALGAPDHAKFLGDGALFVWKVPETLAPAKIVSLTNRLFNLKTGFEKVVDACADVVPVVDLPRSIRFGLARGTVYELARRDKTGTEYIGYCINLASRLQGYCKDLGFIASARIGSTREVLKRHGYTRVVAKALRGFPRELVIVDKREYLRLPDTVREQLFEDAPREGVVSAG